MSESWQPSGAWPTQLAPGRRRALIPYLTAGFPDPTQSLAALRAVDELADVIEVGVPFSDPLADGPTIQASTFTALGQGMTLSRTLELIDQADIRAPVVLFTYLNPVMQYGIERLLRDAADAGVSALLLTDLPAGGDPDVERTILESPLDLIRLVAPTSTPARTADAVRNARGFVYLIARLGVTGASAQLSGDLAASVQRVREATSLPIAVGFGVSTGAQARAVADLADGVVVGSAVVDALRSGGLRAMMDLLRVMRVAIDAQ